MKPADDLSKRDTVIVDLFVFGFTLQKIGDIFGISRERVRQILKQQGIAPRRSA